MRSCERKPDRSGLILPPSPARMSVALMAALLFAAFPAAGAETSVGGWSTLTWHEGELGYRLNDMNRNDNAFSTLRMNVMAQVALDDHLTLNAEYMIDVASSSSLSNTFLRPWASYGRLFNRAWLNLQVGSLPLVFGTYGERANTTANPVIGIPLMHGYHTSLSMMSVPVNGDSLLARRGQGQFGINYRTGSGNKGMPMVYEPCWDSGLQLFGAAGVVEYAAAVTNGTPSAPTLFGNETNDEPGFTGRLGLSNLPGPLFGARLGLSAATGAYLGDGVAIPPGLNHEDYDQVVYGYDVEYGTGPVLVRSEGIWNRWEMMGNDNPATWLPDHVDSRAFYIESRLTVAPGIFLGGRYDDVNFQEITRPTGERIDWDTDVRRLEVGAGWRGGRQWEVRGSLQFWRYPDYEKQDCELGALQLRMDF